MSYVVEALVSVITIGWLVREFLKTKNYRDTCAARLRKAEV